METTPGYRTATFWLALLSTTCAAIMAGGADLGSAAGGMALVLGGLTAAGYAAFRAFKKSEDATKPAWKTTEFWLSIGSGLVSALYASGVISEGGNAEKIVGVVAMLLTALGYGVMKPTKK